jgi:hypothetical protein
MPLLSAVTAKGAKRRTKLSSEFQLAIDDAAFRGYSRDLAKLLRSQYSLSQEDRAMLADYIEGKIRRGRGRPNQTKGFRLDFLAEGERAYRFIKNRWERINGKRLKFKLRDGTPVTIRRELCRRIAKKLGHPEKAEMLEEYVKRAQSRR